MKPEAGEVIILSGTSCAGKTSLAREIQKISIKPYLSTGNDDFLPMFPLKYVGLDKSIQPSIHIWPEPGGALTKEGFEVIVETAGAPPVFHLYCGATAWSFYRGMHSAFAALAKAGNHVVIADVVTEPLLMEYCQALAGLKVYLVHVQCSLEELERRERAHANRTVGGARVQLAAVSRPGEFDLVVDSEKNSADVCARQVLDFVAANPPKAFDRLSAGYAGGKPVEFPVRVW